MTVAEPNHMETRSQQTPFRGKRGFIAALVALVAAGLTRESDEYKETQKRGYRHGKHNGAQPGAFGGPNRAKAHRMLYVKQHAGEQNR